MTKRRASWASAAVAAWVGLCGGLAPAQQAKSKASDDVRHPPSAGQGDAIRAKVRELAEALEPLRPGPDADDRARDAFADAAVFHKAASWIDRQGEYFRKESAGWTLDALALGLDRVEALRAGERPWAAGPGSRGRGYLSRVDGSVQPYAVVVPAAEPEGGAFPLEVVLHGRNATLTEVGFLREHEGKDAPPGARSIVLHVYGRGNNAYRWAGEADVFEAIEAVRRNYPIDGRRVVLKGFSMGGAGAWHLGLHHPDAWASVEAGAGFSETRRYARLRDLPDFQAKSLRIYDATDYALNAVNLPVAGYGGEDDPQFQASTNILEALRSLGFALETDGLVTRGTGDGLDFLRVVGAKTGHKVDPPSREILDAFHAEKLARPREGRRDRLRFVTYTLKYPRIGWLRLEGLDEHYRRAEVRGEIADDVATVGTENVAALAVDRGAAGSIVLDGQVFPLRPAAGGRLPDVYFRRAEGSWSLLDYDESRALEENAERIKRPGLQGPIDDAFTGPFLCVRGTGRPWNPAVGRWAEARLDRFAKDWDRWMRGDLPVKDDVDVTEDDVATKHLVLFGDPGSNPWIARALEGGLPLRWTRDHVELGGREPASTHAPALIAASPLNPRRYIVVNSGHTFGAREFRGTNALLYPRLGDYALIRLGDDEVVRSGYFDERWRLP